MQTQQVTRATKVIVTAHPEFCGVHGWVPGSPYETQFPLTDYTDANGQNIYVRSTLRQRSVWLAPGEYTLLTPTPNP